MPESSGNAEGSPQSDDIIGQDDTTLPDNERIAQAQTRPGGNAQSPWSLPPGAWKTVLKRVWLMIGFHELALLAAGVAFFTFLAITPLIAATVMIYGLIGSVATVRQQMVQIVEVVPPDAASVIEGQLMQVVSTSKGVSGLALAIALVFAIYGGMRAATGMISALNLINGERETRSIASIYLRAFGLTAAAILIAITGLASGGVFAWLQLHSSAVLGSSTAMVVRVLTWTLAIVLGSTGFALIMRFGPDRRPAKWRWITPGSILATLLWIAVSFGFSLYVSYISDYNAMYGSLSAIAIFMMWLFLSAFGVLLGALLNAEIERQTTVDTTRGRDRPPGRRGAVLADLTAMPQASEAKLARKRQKAAESMRHEADSQG
jgi:membrane protein